MKQYTIKVDVPEDIAQGVNGTPAWIEFNTRVINKHRAAMMEVATTGMMVAKINERSLTSDEAQDAALNLVSKFEKAYNAQFEAYAAFVADWNWAGDNGLPLPKPKEGLVFRNELYDYQTEWIGQQIQHLEKYRSTEGNATSTTPS